MKTGSLFAAAGQLGAMLNKADDANVQLLRNFGMRVGAAYQIYDDCLDMAGSESASGKTLGTDLRKGKLTLPLLLLLRSAPPAEHARYCEWILSETPEAAASLLRSAARSDVLDRAVEYGQTLVREAQAELNNSNANAYSAALLALAEGIGSLFEQFRR
jgi:octaprenyl-diphosphate synthase